MPGLDLATWREHQATLDSITLYVPISALLPKQLFTFISHFASVSTNFCQCSYFVVSSDPYFINDLLNNVNVSGFLSSKAPLFDFMDLFYD